MSKTQLILLHDDTTVKLSQWVNELIATKLSAEISIITKTSTEDKFLLSLVELLGENPPSSKIAVLAIFFDGLSEAAKGVFLSLKGWASACPNVILQALNAKKGQHTLFQNGEVVLNSITKRLNLGEQSSNPASDVKTKDDTAADIAVATAVPAANIDFSDVSKDNILKVVAIGQGEGFWLVSGPTSDFSAKISELKGVAASVSCGIFPVTPQPRKLEGKALEVQEFMIRKHEQKSHMELRLAMCGNVDSGKSTLTSVLTRGFKDDGRGSARSKVFNHQHELDTGRTSSISENHLGFNVDGQVINYPEGGPLNPKHAITNEEMAQRSAKILTLYDLAGHERYLKTTVLGMTRSLPDYACVVISANNGIQRMTKEHLGLCLALRLPFFIVITRIDATPDNIRQDTMQSILKILKVPTVKKIAYHVSQPEDVVVCAKNLLAERITPIFEVSNVSGQGIPELLMFMNILPLRKDWAKNLAAPREMIIDSTFFVNGVGTVVGGIVTQGIFHPGDTVLLGPDGLGNFRPTQIKSIHCKGVDVEKVECGCDAAFCLKKEKRSAIRKGNVLVDPAMNPKATWQFEAEIRILYHSTTISVNYEPVIHSQTVRQSARIVKIDREVLRTGDHALVHFHFLYRPEYVTVGSRLIFREGRTKGIGTVSKLLEGFNEDVNGGRALQKQVVREKHNPQKHKDPMVDENLPKKQ